MTRVGRSRDAAVRAARAADRTLLLSAGGTASGPRAAAAEGRGGHPHLQQAQGLHQERRLSAKGILRVVKGCLRCVKGFLHGEEACWL